VNRLLGTDSVRHMSVTTAMQRLTVAHHDTQCDNTKTAHEPENTQARGRFRRWWQVLGSNQRRLSRRFYRLPPTTFLKGSDLRILESGDIFDDNGPCLFRVQ